jgi:peptide/nickel transport system ATP-binding protein
MYLGQVVEMGDSETLFRSPAHPYTRALLSSIPSMDPDRRTEKAPLAGDPPNPIDPPGLPLPHALRTGRADVLARAPPLQAASGGHGGGLLDARGGQRPQPGRTRPWSPHER